MSCTVQTNSAPPRERLSPHRTVQPVFNEETRLAIEDARRGIGLSRGYHSVAELFAALDAEDEDADD